MKEAQEAFRSRTLAAGKSHSKTQALAMAKALMASFGGGEEQASGDDSSGSPQVNQRVLDDMRAQLDRGLGEGAQDPIVVGSGLVGSSSFPLENMSEEEAAKAKKAAEMFNGCKCRKVGQQADAGEDKKAAAMLTCSCDESTAGGEVLPEQAENGEESTKEKKSPEDVELEALDSDGEVLVDLAPELISDRDVDTMEVLLSEELDNDNAGSIEDLRSRFDGQAVFRQEEEQRRLEDVRLRKEIGLDRVQPGHPWFEVDNLSGSFSGHVQGLAVDARRDGLMSEDFWGAAMRKAHHQLQDAKLGK